jgi:hypothetical protein
MKIALFTLSIACLCLCGCSKNSNEQENDQQQFDPLTAPIQEVQALQEKIKAKIKSEEAPFNKNIQKITDNERGAYGEELKAYLKAVEDNVVLRDNVTADLKARLPSNILMGKFESLISKYRPLPSDYNLQTFTNDMETFTKIEKILDIISLDDAVKVAVQKSSLEESILQDHAKRQAIALQLRAQELRERAESILNVLPEIKSPQLGGLQFSIKYRLTEKNEFIPMASLQGINFELKNSEIVLSNFVAFAEWIKNAGPVEIGWKEKDIGKFNDTFGTARFKGFNDGAELQVLKVNYEPSQGGMNEIRFKLSDIENIKQLFAMLPDLTAKAEQELNAKKLAGEKDNKMADELK